MNYSNNLVKNSYLKGHDILAHRNIKYRKEHGQFLTPPLLAAYMVERLGVIQNGDVILDPALGSGTLLCAVVEHLIELGQPLEVYLEGYEIDPTLCKLAHEMLAKAAAIAAQAQVKIHFQIHETDFVLDRLNSIKPRLFDNTSCLTNEYDKIVANPPYFKLRSDDIRVKSGRDVGIDQTNIYAMFLSLGLKLLKPTGNACFIVPRSFCSGSYFNSFRRDFLTSAELEHIHLFESRQDNFEKDDVLQENIVISFTKRQNGSQPNPTTISVSQNTGDLLACSGRQVAAKYTIRRYGKELFLRLPAHRADEIILDILDNWTGSLSSYGLDVSTGPIVPFRVSSFLLDNYESDSAPLIWMNHIRAEYLDWPLSNGKKSKSKPQWFVISDASKSFLLPNANYVVLRRFSTKEEARRLVAAPLLAKRFNSTLLGLENHVNYIHRGGKSLTECEALGLSALYNTTLFDRYFRILNGNTQVNAADLRMLPLPPLTVIEKIGEVKQINNHAFVENILVEVGLLPVDFVNKDTSIS